MTMKRKVTRAAMLGLLTILGPFGCSKSPVQLAQQIAAADRVVLTNVVVTNYSEFTGVEAQRLVRAVSESKGKKLRKGMDVSSIPGCSYLQFYRGTNLLSQVEGEGIWFHIGNVYYHDWSGVLQKAWQTVYEKEDR